MKRTLLGIGLSSLLAITTYAHADDSVPMQQPMSAGSPQAGGTAMQPGSSDQGGTISGTSASGGSGGLTRGEVKRELLTAEQDGQIKRLDQTVYKGQ
jgi:hypothetical protein